MLYHLHSRCWQQNVFHLESRREIRDWRGGSIRGLRGYLFCRRRGSQWSWNREASRLVSRPRGLLRATPKVPREKLSREKLSRKAHWWLSEGDSWRVLRAQARWRPGGWPISYSSLVSSAPALTPTLLPEHATDPLCCCLRSKGGTPWWSPRIPECWRDSQQDEVRNMIKQASSASSGLAGLRWMEDGGGGQDLGNL